MTSVCSTYNCFPCHYRTLDPREYTQHVSSKQHISTLVCLHDTRDCDTVFMCELCDYCTQSKYEYKRHLATKKHVSMELNRSSTKGTTHVHTCDQCGKAYSSRTSLWYHKKKCVVSCKEVALPERREAPVDKDLVIMLLKQNAELVEIVKNGTTHGSYNNTTTTHTNSHNKAFNLNFFLNETCKNAMNINDFMDSIQLQLSDFVKVGEVGFVKGISDIIVQNLNSLDETVRPIHCTDKKRETFYVKDEDVWAKEEADKKRLKKMINHVAFKNEKLMKTYKEVHPDYNNPESNRSDQYSKMVIEAMDCDEDHRAQIIRLLSKATSIQRAEAMALTLH